MSGKITLDSTTMGEQDTVRSRPNVPVVKNRKNEVKSRGVWHRRIVATGTALAVIAGLAGLGFMIWANNAYGPGPAAVAALKSTDLVTVVEDDGFEFRPAGEPNVGLIIYPGARVDPGSYAVTAHPIAEAGYLVIVPDVRLNLAIFDVNAADKFIQRHPEIDYWVVGGHSLGGTVSANYAASHSDEVDGLVFWGSYPPDDSDLSEADLVVMSIYGTLDGLSTPIEVQGSGSQLPADATFVAIEGGNHAQFGDYGAQSGDNQAEISPADQWKQIEQSTIALLDEVDSPFG